MSKTLGTHLVNVCYKKREYFVFCFLKRCQTSDAQRLATRGIPNYLKYVIFPKHLHIPVYVRALSAKT